MTTLREAAQMALDALEHGLPIIEDFGGKEQLQLQHKAIAVLYEALRAALAQPEQEPEPDEIERIMLEVWQDVGDPQFPHIAPPQRERILCGCGDQIMPDDGAECGTCVTARNAVKREWQGLTPEDKRIAGIPLYTDQISMSDAFDVIERILKEKNCAPDK